MSVNLRVAKAIWRGHGGTMTTGKNGSHMDRFAISAFSFPAFCEELAMRGGTYKLGAKVRKKTGYEFPGEIVGVANSKAGALRYVVECTVPGASGMLHIFSPEQLELDE